MTDEFCSMSMDKSRKASSRDDVFRQAAAHGQHGLFEAEPFDLPSRMSNTWSHW